MATPATACIQALSEATTRWPNRSRISDGIMGDERHSRRTSDHNLGNAFDLTHDPANGCDAHALARMLAERKDPRVKYIISNAQIWNPAYSPNWRAYNGANPHTKHMHVSILESARDNRDPWWAFLDEQQPKPEGKKKVAKICWNKDRAERFCVADDYSSKWHIPNADIEKRLKDHGAVVEEMADNLLAAIPEFERGV